MPPPITATRSVADARPRVSSAQERAKNEKGMEVAMAWGCVELFLLGVGTSLAVALGEEVEAALSEEEGGGEEGGGIQRGQGQRGA